MKLSIVLPIFLIWIHVAFADSSQHKVLKDNDLDRPSENDFVQKELKRFEEIRKKILGRMFNDVDFGDSESEDDDIHDSFGAILGGGLKGMFESSSSGLKMTWSEDETHRVLEIELNDPKTQVDFDINKSLISIKGTITQTNEYGASTSQFNHSYSVPSDVDGEKAKIEQVDKKILIKFPYLTGAVKTAPAPTVPKLKKMKGGVAI